MEQDITLAALVGRRRELEELGGELDRAFAGKGGLVLLTGEPGIGKTRLASELSRDAEARGACVLWGRCWEGGGAPAYWPWLQVLRDCERGVAAASQLVGENDANQLRQFIPGITTDEPELLGESVSEHARFRFFDATAQILYAAANRKPLLIVLDDLHAADEPSLQLLRFVARHLHDARVLIVAPYRDSEVRLSPLLTRRFATLAREGHYLHLRGLSANEVRQCITIVSKQDPPAVLVDAIHRATDGNPFFIDVITRMLVAEGRLHAEQCDLANFQMPEEVREAIRQRLEPLGADVRAVLEIAAVCGREFEDRLVDRVAGLHRSLPTGALLDAAIKAGIIQTKPQAPGTFCFVHNLVADTLYHDQKPEVRAQLHRDVGRILEELDRGRGDLNAAQLAHHYLAAGSCGDAEKAIEFAELAGRRVFTLHGYEEAAHWYERALHALDRLAERESVDQLRATDPRPHGRSYLNAERSRARESMGQWNPAQPLLADRRSVPDLVSLVRESIVARDELRCRLLVALGESHRCAGDVMCGDREFRAALDVARRAGASSVFARAAIGLSASLAETGRVDESLVAVLREALHRLPNEDSLLRVALLGRLTSALYFSPARAERERTGAEAVAMARRLGDASGLILVLRTRHVDLRRPGLARERLALADELLPLAEKIGDSEAMFEARYWRAGALLELGEAQRALGEIGTYQRLAGERRQLNEQWEGALLRAAIALLWGRFEESERFSHQAFAIGQRSEAANAPQFFSVQTFLRLYEQDRLHEIEADVSSFVEQYPQLPIWRCGRAFLYAETGSIAAARAEFELLAEHDFRCIPRDLNWLAAMSFLAEVCAVVGEASSAAALYEQLAPYAAHNVVIAMSVACRGSVAHYLGLLAATCYRFDLAVEHFERAMLQNARMGALPALAHTQFRCAQLLLRQRRRQQADPAIEKQARDLLREALATARSLGMAHLESAILRATADGADLHELPPPVAEAPVTREQTAVFRREGEGWMIDFDGTAIRLAHTKGLLYLALLLANPGRSCHVNALLELAQARQSGESLRRTVPEESDVASDLSDRVAMTLAADARVDVMQQRRMESRRVAVTKAISLAMQAIGTHHPSLRQYLAATIKTGRVCIFNPDTERRITWRV